MQKSILFDKIKKMVKYVVCFGLTLSLTGCGNNTLIDAIFPAKDPTQIGPGDIITIINNITTWLVYFVAFVGTVFFIVGGIQYLSSFGDKEKMEQAKKTIMWAAIGIIVIVTAKLAVNFALTYVLV